MSPKPTDRMNADEFDDEGLPGIDENYPPEQAWAVNDPALVRGGSETPDDLRTRVAREHASAADPAASPADEVPTLMSPSSGDPAVEGDLVDTEATAVADVGRGDPDAGPAAEEAAVHITDEP